MSGLSKQEQLRGGSDQAHRRAERAGKRYKPGERNGPDPLSSTDHIITWDEATEEARRLNAEMTQKYAGRWFGACAAVGEVCNELGIFNTRELTGRNALLVARLAKLMIEDANRRG